MSKTALLAAVTGSLLALSLAPAMAADPIRPAPVAAAPYVAPVAAIDDIWSGFYVGAHTGAVLPDISGDSEKWFGGVHAGYNVQNGNFVFGGEVGADLYDDFTYNLGGGAALTQNWSANINARAGFAIDNTLIYGTVGLIAAEFKPAGTVTSAADTHGGFVFGGGVEHQFGNGIGGRLEYTQARYQDVSWTAGGANTKSELINHTIKAGVNFHF